jgi:hypothetical protein
LSVVSVETKDRRFDPDGLLESSVERLSRRRPLEAGQSATGIGAAPRLGRAEREAAVPGDEAKELLFR